MIDEAEDLLVQADQIARQQGYFDRPQSELLTMAEEAAEAHYNAAGLTHRIVEAIASELSAGRRHSLVDPGETAGEEQKDAFLEYLAIKVALDEGARKQHAVAMIEKFGPGFLAGT